MWLYLNTCDPSPIAKSIPIVKQSSYLEWPKDYWSKPQSGMTSKLLMDFLAPTSSTEVFHVRGLVLRGLEKAWQMSEADYFLRSCDLSKKYDLNSYSSKMSVQLGQEVWIRLSKNLPKNGMTVDGQCYELRMWEPYIEEKGFIFLPTIGANEYKGAGKKRYRGSKDFRGAKMSEGLRTSENDPIYTHPNFAEVVMGYPLGWSELTPWAIQYVLSKRKKHLKG